VVDGDEVQGAKLAEYLGARGMTAIAVETLAAARQNLKRTSFDALFLDLNLGEHAGLALARELAESGGPPIVLGSSRIDESDRVLGLELGADDYLVKPYSFREQWRGSRSCSAGRARPPSPARRVARFGRWMFDESALRLVNPSGSDVLVTGGEMELLRVFLEHPDRVLGRNQILALSRRTDPEVFERAIDVLVGRLRRKIEDDPRRPRLILTVRGEGYRFTERVSWTSSSE